MILAILSVRKFWLVDWQWSVGLLWWLLGAVLGFVFVFGDRFIYRLFYNQKGEGGVRDEAKRLLKEDYDQKELVTRSFLFLILWLVLAFFAVTSVVNFFGRGFVLGVGIHLVFDLIFDYTKDKGRLDEWFWQIKRTLEPEEKRGFVVFVSVAFVLLALGL